MSIKVKFFSSKNVGRHFCSKFQRVCSYFEEVREFFQRFYLDFTGFCSDFYQIKTFGGALTPLHPTPGLSCGLWLKWN